MFKDNELSARALGRKGCAVFYFETRKTAFLQPRPDGYRDCVTAKQALRLTQSYQE